MQRPEIPRSGEFLLSDQLFSPTLGDMKLPAVCVVILSVIISVSAKDYSLHSFKKTQLTTEFWSEGATMGDFNHDGKPDIAAGPFYYAGPDFQQRQEFMPPPAKGYDRKGSEGKVDKVGGYDPHGYSKNFFAYTYDFNKDGWDDIIILGFPGEDSSWFENPKGLAGHWQRHLVLAVTDNESPTFLDITGDGKPEVVCNSGGYFGYAEADWNEPSKVWKFHAITPKGPWQRFSHGMGVGDVNTDGKLDILEKDGWWEQPKSLAGDPIWIKHAWSFGTGGAQMFAYDVDGDGDSDVITSLAAHGYGLAWYENSKENNEIKFKEHIIINKEAKDSKYGVAFSQLHALDLVDMDGDGVKDLVTGKRYWAHGPSGDAEPNAAAVLYWFKTHRNADKTVDFIPYLIDNDSGIGTQVMAGKLNGDKWPDVVVGNKKGAFSFVHEVKNVTQAEWEKAQPKPFIAK